MMKRHILLIFLSLLLGRVGVGFLFAQTPVSVGSGSSLWELELYGTARCDADAPSSVTNIKSSNFRIFKFISNGEIYIFRNGAVYTVDGAHCVLPQD